jgi:hypothetical protein
MQTVGMLAVREFELPSQPSHCQTLPLSKFDLSIKRSACKRHLRRASCPHKASNEVPTQGILRAACLKVPAQGILIVLAQCISRGACTRHCKVLWPSVGMAHSFDLSSQPIQAQACFATFCDDEVATGRVHPRRISAMVFFCWNKTAVGGGS